MAENLIAGAVLDLHDPCTVHELQLRPELSKMPEQSILATLQTLVEIGIICKIGHDRYIGAELAQAYTESHKSSARCSEPLLQTSNDMASSARRSFGTAPLCVNPTPKTQPVGGAQRAVVPYQGAQVSVQRSQNSYAVASVQNFDSDADETQRVLGRLKRILVVFQPGDPPMPGHQIAKLSKLGEAKSAVNRELHFLKDQKVLGFDGKSWTCLQKCSDDRLMALASMLAKKPSGKKESRQLVATGSAFSSGAGPQDCHCPNKGPSCVHNHLHQTNIHHNYNIQVGDNNQLAFMDKDFRPNDQN